MLLKLKRMRYSKAFKKMTLLGLILSLPLIGTSQYRNVGLIEKGLHINFILPNSNPRVKLDCTKDIVNSSSILDKLKVIYKEVGLQSTDAEYRSNFELRCDYTCRRIFFRTMNPILVIPKNESTPALKAIISADKFYDFDNMEYRLFYNLKVELPSNADTPSRIQVELFVTIERLDRKIKEPQWKTFTPINNFESNVENGIIKALDATMTSTADVFSGLYCSGK